MKNEGLKKKAMQASLLSQLIQSDQTPSDRIRSRIMREGSDDGSHPSEDGNRQSASSEKNVDDRKNHKDGDD